MCIRDRYYPSNEVNKNIINLKPVMSLKTNIVHIKEVERGTSISYNRTFTTERKSKIATLPVGYAAVSYTNLDVYKRQSI